MFYNILIPFFNIQDFFLTVTLAVFWLSGSAAWANGLNGLKGTMSSIIGTQQCIDVCRSVRIGSFSELSISVVSCTVVFCIYNILK
jgi:UDP-N-acetylmuramyl pentapeptide phosphotransferase/UDP-N-acetylglucosamine-1-phosphate transferase